MMRFAKWYPFLYWLYQNEFCFVLNDIWHNNRPIYVVWPTRRNFWFSFIFQSFLDDFLSKVFTIVSIILDIIQTTRRRIQKSFGMWILQYVNNHCLQYFSDASDRFYKRKQLKSGTFTMANNETKQFRYFRMFSEANTMKYTWHWR